MTEATVATDVHQTLDVHRGFTAQITFNGEGCDLVADFFQIGVGQILHLLGISDAACLADLAGAGATNAEDGGQANFSMFVRRNVDASDTCHFRPLKLVQSALTLLVTRIGTDHANNALTANDFAVAADFLDRSRNSHGSSPKTLAFVPAYLARNTILALLKS